MSFILNQYKPLMERLPVWLNDLGTLWKYVGRAAKAYFEAWQGLPIRWNKKGAATLAESA